MAIRIRLVGPGHLLRRLLTEDWLTLFLVSGAVLVSVRLVEVAEWVVTPMLTLTASLGALLGLLASRVQWKPGLAHLMALVAGVVVVYLQSSALAGGEGLLARMGEANVRLALWWSALLGNEISNDPLPFALILSAIAWSVGYLSSWAIFKLSNLWLGIIPSAVGLFMNLTYLPERFFIYMFPYLLATMLLLTRMAALQREADLVSQGIAFPASLRRWWMGYALVMSSLVIGLVYLLPPNNASNDALKRVWNISREPAVWFQQEFGRLFSAINPQKEGVTQRFGPVLPILAKIPLTDESIFSGDVPFATYWRVRSYPTYSPGGWTTEGTIVEQVSLDPFEFSDDEEDLSSGIGYSVELAKSTSYMYLPSDNPFYIDVDTRIETHKGAPFPGDLVTLRPRERLGSNDSYAGSFIPAIFTEHALRATDQDYPEWVTDWYLELPESLPKRISDLANMLTSDALTPYDAARAIENYLRTVEYGPSPTIPAYDGDWVDLFLFQTGVGHSDHFSSSMAVMLRSVGIPSRIVSGFGPGTPDIETRTFDITGRDLHSWPEAFFPTLGWVEFEPTPIYGLRPRAVEDLVGFDQAFLLSGLGGTEQQLVIERNDTDREAPLVDPGGGRLPGGEGLQPIPLIYSPSPLSASGALLWALAAVWAGGTWLVVRRIFLVLPGPQAAYPQLRRTANLLGMGVAEAQTPLEFGRVLAAAVPEARGDITLICETFSRTRYGGGELSRWDGLRVRLAWLRVRSALTRRSFG